MIFHDDWSVYQNLDKHGYDHGTVVHTYEFKSKEGVCTNTIEGKYCVLSQYSWKQIGFAMFGF